MRLKAGWVEILLGDHVYIAGRIGWRGLKADEYRDSGPNFLSVPNLNYGDNVDFSKVYHISRERYDESPEIQVHPEDVLLVKDGAGIGKVGDVNQIPGPTTINSSLLLVRPSDQLLTSRYLFYYLKGPQFRELALSRISGSATPHLFQKDIRRLAITVPPLSEQNRIAAKLDALLARVNAIRKRLDTIPKLLARFRQSVLTTACTGKLCHGRCNNPQNAG